MAKESAKSPRISLNKLAEFMLAKPARQRQILRDQKYPTEYKGMYHKEAAEVIARCLASNLEDLEVVQKSIDAMDQITSDKIGTQRRIAANIDAMESFLAIVDDIDLKDGDPEVGGHNPPKLVIHGVEVSVRPEIILRGKGKTGALVGALKLHFPRTFPLAAETAGYVSAVSHEWTKRHLAYDASPHGPFCIVLDIGSRSPYAGVKATAARMKDVEATCKNIAALWPSITSS